MNTPTATLIRGAIALAVGLAGIGAHTAWAERTSQRGGALDRRHAAGPKMIS